MSNDSFLCNSCKSFDVLRVSSSAILQPTSVSYGIILPVSSPVQGAGKLLILCCQWREQKFLKSLVVLSNSSNKSFYCLPTSMVGTQIEGNLAISIKILDCPHLDPTLSFPGT